MLLSHHVLVYLMGGLFSFFPPSPILPRPFICFFLLQLLEIILQKEEVVASRIGVIVKDLKVIG